MDRSNCGLSLIGEPPCWGSGELPLFPQSWRRALSKIDIFAHSSQLGRVELKGKSLVTAKDLCGSTWVKEIRKLESIESDLPLGDLIVAFVSDAVVQFSDDLDLPITPINSVGISGGTALPFQITTCDALTAAGLYSDEGIRNMLAGTYLELLQKVNDLSVVLDFAVTANAWLNTETGRRPFFEAPKFSETLVETFRAMRFRAVRSVGYSPEANWYTSNFADVLGKRFGFDWQGKWTLDECSQDLNLTGERIRRIEKEALIAFSPRSWGKSEVMNNLCGELQKQSGDDIFFTDHDVRHLIVDRSAAENLLQMIGYGGSEYQYVSASDVQRAEFGRSIGEIRREAYQFSGKIGFVIEENLKTHLLDVYTDWDDSKFEAIKPLIAEKLNLPFGFMYVESRNKSFFLSWTQNILSLQGDLRFDEYFEASVRYCLYRLPGIVHPPRSVVREWLKTDARFTLTDQDYVSIIEPIAVKLGEIQQWLRDQILSATGAVIHRAELLDKAREFGVNPTSISIYCSYERYFKPVDTYCVTLTGMYPSQEFIDLAYMRANVLIVESTIDQFEISKNHVVVLLTTGSNMCNQGMWSFNKALANSLGAKNFELRADEQVVGRSSFFGNTTTSWTSALAALGIVPGDKIKISFDTKSLVATVDRQDSSPGFEDAD